VVAFPNTSRQPSNVANSRTIEAWRVVDRNAHVCQRILAGWADRYLSLYQYKGERHCMADCSAGASRPCVRSRWLAHLKKDGPDTR